MAVAVVVVAALFSFRFLCLSGIRILLIRSLCFYPQRLVIHHSVPNFTISLYFRPYVRSPAISDFTIFPYIES